MDEAKVALCRKAAALIQNLTVRWVIDHAADIPPLLRRVAQGGAAGDERDPDN